MFVQDIPTEIGNPNYTFRVRLDGRNFTFNPAWNQREERWYLSVLDETGVNPLAQSVKLITNWPLLRSFRHDVRMPSGVLMVVSRTLDTTPPKFDDLGLGLRCTLTYFTNEG